MTTLALRSRIALALAAVLVASPASGQDASETATDAVDGRSPAHTHIHHVAVTFRGTPDDQGLHATAVAEAEIAHQHAMLALRDPTDVDAMVRHTRHVMHALDPSTAEGGPGLGYGAIRAADRTAHYISLAAASDGATQAIETHSTHIETAALSAMASGEAALEIALEIVEATQPSEPPDTTAGAEPAPEEPAGPEEIEALVTELAGLTDAMLNGVDTNGDGRIGWQEGEGGLAQAAGHLELLREAEGLGGR